MKRTKLNTNLDDELSLKRLSGISRRARGNFEAQVVGVRKGGARYRLRARPIGLDNKPS